MSNATRGRALEHEIKKLFEANGWAVIRGASSKGHFDSVDGKVKPDLIASRSGRKNDYRVDILAMQCKVSKI